MGWANGLRKEYHTQNVVIAGVSGAYGYGPRFGATPNNQAWDSFQGCTAWFESGVTDATCELWVPKLAVAKAGTRSFKEYLNDDFVYSGQSFTAAEVMETFVLAGVPCFELRVKSGGTGGTAVIAATAI